MTPSAIKAVVRHDDPHPREMIADALKVDLAMVAATDSDIGQIATIAANAIRPPWRSMNDPDLQWAKHQPLIFWCVHANARYAKDAIREGWEGPVIAQWSGFNGGGWTWHGLCGELAGWIFPSELTLVPPARREVGA